MKVLLIGEFSALHTELKKGLKKLGVDVDLVNYGDGFKKYSTDWSLGPLQDGKFYDYIRWIFEKINYLRMKKYDVIQFIHPNCLRRGYSDKIIFSLLKHAKISVVLSAGCDGRYARNAEKFHLCPCPTCKKKDLHASQCYLISSKEYYDYETEFLTRVDAIVPTTYEYQRIYKDFTKDFHHKVTKIIRMPIDLEENPVKNTHNKKILVFHPLNREGFKGTPLIRAAFSILQKKYADKAEFLIAGKMPFKEYMQLTERVDILVDQMYGITYGMATLFAMAQGKIVITGNKQESINDTRTPWYKESPLIDIGYTVDDIVSNVSFVIDSYENNEELRKKSRAYVEAYHDNRKIAQEYLALYKQIAKKKKLAKESDKKGD